MEAELGLQVKLEVLLGEASGEERRRTIRLAITILQEMLKASAAESL